MAFGWAQLVSVLLLDIFSLSTLSVRLMFKFHHGFVVVSRSKLAVQVSFTIASFFSVTAVIKVWLRDMIDTLLHNTDPP